MIDFSVVVFMLSWLLTQYGARLMQIEMCSFLGREGVFSYFKACANSIGLNHSFHEDLNRRLLDLNLNE